ncbi:hypothetical protein A2U01_0057731, partial [Trifolium medium]|nr:hypothetical protein [Trifolium medium]
AHLLVTDPQTHPVSSTKGSPDESPEASFARHKGILENILTFNTTSCDKSSSHHTHARA